MLRLMCSHLYMFGDVCGGLPVSVEVSSRHYPTSVNAHQPASNSFDVASYERHAPGWATPCT